MSDCWVRDRRVRPLNVNIMLVFICMLSVMVINHAGTLVLDKTPAEYATISLTPQRRRLENYRTEQAELETWWENLKSYFNAWKKKPKNNHIF